jgi:hypothetical protein
MRAVCASPSLLWIACCSSLLTAAAKARRSGCARSARSSWNFITSALEPVQNGCPDLITSGRFQAKNHVTSERASSNGTDFSQFLAAPPSRAPHGYRDACGYLAA